MLIKALNTCIAINRLQILINALKMNTMSVSQLKGSC